MKKYPAVPNHNFTDRDAINAIVGEFAVNDYDEMKRLAHAIRNRGTLHGVYGLHAKHNKHESGYIWGLAKEAWEESAYEEDTVKGADSWYSFDDVKRKGPPLDKRFLFKSSHFYFYKTKHQSEVLR